MGPSKIKSLNFRISEIDYAAVYRLVENYGKELESHQRIYICFLNLFLKPLIMMCID